MRALTLERWAVDPELDTADPSSPIPYSFTWTDTADPTDLRPYAFTWNDPDTAGPNWSAGLGGIGKGAALGAGIGTAIGTVFPGLGNAVGGTIGGVVGAIGGFVAGLFGGGKPKPTPRWVADLLEDGRRALHEVPPNPSKMLDAVLVTSGKYSRAAYLRAKKAGKLPSQKYDRNRSATMAKAAEMDKGFGPQIAAHLKGLTLGEKALVSAAMPLGHGTAALDALRAIRAHTERVTQARPEPKAFFPPDVLEQLRREYQPDAPDAPTPEPALEPTPPADAADDGDTGEPSPMAKPPTLADLPKPAWHVSPPVMPRHLFEKLLVAVPILKQLPKEQLRALAGMQSQVHDVSGVDAVARQYVMTPGETFAGIAAQLTGDAARAVELHAANPHWSHDRMRLDIPPGWLEWTPLITRVPSDTGAVSGKDSPRTNITKRVIEVRAGDWPEKIATRTGAKAADPQWFRTLKSVNPHKAVASNGNFETLFAGELLNYPDTWPASAEAKPAPGQGGAILPPGNTPPEVIPPGIIPPGITPPGAPPPSPVPPAQPPTTPPGTAPAGATANVGTTAHAQGILMLFAQQHPEVARPQDYGTTLGDISGAPTDRMRSILSCFQMWWNTRNPPQMLRVDGVLDPATSAALTAYAAEGLKDIPLPPKPSQGGGGVPSAPSSPNQGGGGAPSHSNPGNAPSADDHWSPGIYYTPWLQPVSPPSPAPTPPQSPPPTTAEPKHAEGSKDDGAAALMVGGTVLSLLLR